MRKAKKVAKRGKAGVGERKSGMPIRPCGLFPDGRTARRNPTGKGVTAQFLRARLPELAKHTGGDLRRLWRQAASNRFSVRFIAENTPPD
jgi:hypothetical protein